MFDQNGDAAIACATRIVVGAAADAERAAALDTSTCLTCRRGGFGPTHTGSPKCLSGSLASGGRRSHCSCDTCF